MIVDDLAARSSYLVVDLEYKYGTNPERPHKALTVAFEMPVADEAPALPAK